VEVKRGAGGGIQTTKKSIHNQTSLSHP